MNHTSTRQKCFSQFGLKLLIEYQFLPSCHPHFRLLIFSFSRFIDGYSRFLLTQSLLINLWLLLDICRS